MWIIRVAKNMNTNKLDGFTLFDENTMGMQNVSTHELINLIRSGSYNIYNVELTKNRVPHMIQMNNHRNLKSYSSEIVEKYTIYNYCIVTGYNTSRGTINWAAYTPSGLLCGENSSLKEICDALNVSIDKLNFYNAFIEKEDGEYTIKLYAGDNRFRSLGKISYNKDNLEYVNNDWLIEYDDEIGSTSNIKYMEHHKGLASAMLPNGILSLNKFGGGVNTLILPDSLVRLGIGCFEDLDDLKELIFGKGLKHIPENCCSNSVIKHVKFSGYEKTIGDSAFEDCCYLKCGIYTTANIGKRAFMSSGVTSLRTRGAEFIDILAFAYCDKLERVSLDEGLQIIKGGAFKGCSKLEYVKFPSTTKFIGRDAFKDCKKLKEVVLPLGCKYDESTFPKWCRVNVREDN